MVYLLNGNVPILWERFHDWFVYGVQKLMRLFNSGILS